MPDPTLAETNRLASQRAGLSAHGLQHNNLVRERPVLQRERGATSQGAPPHVGGYTPQFDSRDRLNTQASERRTEGCPVELPPNEESLSNMVRQIVRDSLRREEDESDWGFAPSKTPFTERVLNAPYPHKFAAPSMPAYRGSGDPNEFLYRYDWSMNAARATDEVKCRHFPIYLEGVALLWFRKLPARSIDSFADLARQLKEQFRLYATKARDIQSLAALEQAPGEPLRTFLNRFNTALAEIGNPEPTTILSNLTRAIDKDSPFAEWIKMKEPATLKKFYKKADEYIRLESAPPKTVPSKAVTTVVAHEVKPNNNAGGNSSGNQKRNNENAGKDKRGGKKSRFFRGNELTPLIDTPENVFVAAKDTVPFPTPQKVKEGKGAGKSGRFCLFHNQPGHDTNDCRHLKQLIEEMIRNGQLQQYIKRRDQQLFHKPSSSTQGQVTSHQDRGVSQNQERPVINVISGGPHPADRSWGEMERYSQAHKHDPADEVVYALEDSAPPKQQKTFNDDIVFRARDSTGVEAPTQDPLVVSAGIGPATVRRVLVDSGSSCNILFKRTFDQMKLTMADVKASTHKIVGFTGEPKQPVGTITLPVELGEGERKVVRNQVFVVVDEFSSYNAFLGRPTLAAFKICLAPWCLLMKFPTDTGVGIVRGDQHIARECYLGELRESKRKERAKDAVAAPLRIKEPSL